MAWNNKDLVSITIRVEKYVLEDLKREAGRDMIHRGRYQQLGRRIWQAWVDGTEMPARYIPDPKKKKVAK